MRKLLVSVVFVVLAACGRGSDDAFVEAAPIDPEAFTLELTGDPSEGALVSEDGVQRQGLDGAPELVRDARQGLGWLNQQVREAIAPIAALVSQAGQVEPGEVRVFGPKDRGTASYLFTIKKLSDNRFGWKLEARPQGSTGDYTLVAAGHLAKGELAHRGRGSIGVDFDTLRAIDTTVKAQGKLFCGFAHVGESKALIYALRGFTPDAAQVEPITAAYAGHRTMPSRLTRVRLAAKWNLEASPTDAKELVRVRARYIPGVGGRADAIATQGDVPAGKAYYASACWDAQEKEGFAVLRLCTLGSAAGCQVIYTRGDRANCRPGAEIESMPPVDENSLEDEADAPSAVEPQTEMPPAP